jgi:hypothetical protein
VGRFLECGGLDAALESQQSNPQVDNPSAFRVVREFRQKCSKNNQLRKASPISLYFPILIFALIDWAEMSRLGIEGTGYSLSGLSCFIIVSESYAQSYVNRRGVLSHHA